MSNSINTQLLERAADLLDEITNHPSGIDKSLENAIDKNDLDEVYRIVTLVEGELSQEAFYNNGAFDVY